jgi:radical SAM-linked protein
MTVARSSDAPELSQRDTLAAWETAIVASGLPVAVGDAAKPKPRVAFGAPLSVGLPAEAELIDVVLTERLPAWHVRGALTPHTPVGWTLEDLADVWLGGPPLAGRVVAADYRVTLGPASDSAALGSAAADLLGARTLPRERAKGDGMVRYDLRPLLVDVRVVKAGPPVVVRVRTRFHPELGTGRPEEVVLALADRVGVELPVERMVRERLVLADELD